MRFAVTIFLILFLVLLSSTTTGCTYLAIRKRENELKERESALEAERSRKAYIQVAKRDILAGQVFTEDNLEEQEIQELKCPIDAVYSLVSQQACDELLGKKAKYDIPKGRLISEHDIEAKIEKKSDK